VGGVGSTGQRSMQPEETGPTHRGNFFQCSFQRTGDYALGTTDLGRSSPCTEHGVPVFTQYALRNMSCFYFINTILCTAS
jgi:hypothetical protein